MRDPEELIQTLSDTLVQSGTVSALFLAGSHGRGTADAWSDIDFVALTSGEPDQTVAAWHACVAGAGRIVYHRVNGRGARRLVNTYLAEGTRLDLFVTEAVDIGGRFSDRVKPLHDPEGLYEGLSPAPVGHPDPKRVAYLIDEVLRILFLLPVTAGRGEDVVAAMGYGFLRDHLVTLLKEIHAPGADGGLLHLSRLLPQAELDMLAALPAPIHARDPAPQLAVARAFVDRARPLAAEIGVPWPQQWEDDLRSHLAKSLQITL